MRQQWTAHSEGRRQRVSARQSSAHRASSRSVWGELGSFLRHRENFLLLLFGDSACFSCFGDLLEHCSAVVCDCSAGRWVLIS